MSGAGLDRLDRRDESDDDERGPGRATRPTARPRRTTSPRCRTKWQPVWDELHPFRADDDSPREKRYALTMFPYPSGDLHMGHAEVFALHDVIARYWWQRGYEVLNPMGWDSFGLPAENAAIRDNEHPATYTYANIETQAESFQQYGVSFDWSRRLQHLRPGVLPLDAVAVPEVPRARAGLPQEQPGQLVPQRPDRAGQRAGRRRPLRALRRRGHQARADPVVLQDHRLRPGLLDDMDALEPTWPDRVITAAAQLDRPVRGRARRLRGRGPRRAGHASTRPGRTRCSARRSWWSRPTPRWPASWSPTSSGRRTTPTWRRSARPPTSTGCRPTGRRPASSWACTRPTRSPASRSRCGPPTTCWPTTAPARSWRCPAQDQRDWDFAKEFDLPIVRTVQPPEGWEGEAYTGDGPAVNSRQRRDRRWTAWTSTRPSARSSTGWRRKGVGSGAVNFRLRDWLLSPAALLGRADPDHPLPGLTARSPVPEDQLPVVLPELRGADLKPKGVSPLAAAEDWVNVDCPHVRRPGQARQRHDGHVRRLVVVLPALLLAARRHARPFDAELVDAWMPCDMYVGGVEHAVLHLLYAASSPRCCTTWAWSTSSSRSPRC